jgi:hypothetical protein
MPQKKLRTNKKHRILKGLGKILSRRIFLKPIECIRNSRLIRKITTKSYLKTV